MAEVEKTAVILRLVGHDDKSRPANVREQMRLRATLADEPSSGYSYTDESRVESVRGGAAVRTTRASKVKRARPADDKGTRASWPPMPSIPPELEGAAGDAFAGEADADSDAVESLVSEPPRSAARAGGAIWEAMPSVIQEQPAQNDADAKPPADVPDASDEQVREETEQRTSKLELTYLGRSSTVEAVGALGPYEQLVERGAWDQLAQELPSPEGLSPALKLLSVIAKREARAADDKQNVLLTREAITALALLLGVPETSPTALMLSKRLLRRNPWNKSRKPSKKLSFGLMLLGIGFGAGVGWLVTKFLL